MPDTNHDLDELMLKSIQVEVPANVEERLHRRLVEFRTKIAEPPPSRFRTLINSLRHSASIRVPLITAAVFAVVVTLAFIPRGSNAGRVYAAAAMQLRSARSLVFTVELAPNTEIDFAYRSPGFRRASCSWGTEIRSDGSGKQIILMHLTKSYIVGKEEQSATPNFVLQFKALPKTPDQSIGEKWAGSRKLLGYRVHEAPSGSAIPGLSALDIWVDAASGNPDHIDLSIQEPGKPLYQMHIKNMHMDEEIDSSLFDMTPPAGYTKIAIPDATPQGNPPSIQQGDLQPMIEQSGALTAVVLPMKGSFIQTRAEDKAVREQLERIGKQLEKIGITPNGPAFGRYDPDRNWVAGYPVPPGTRIDAPFEILALPETTVASVIVKGPWDQEFDSPLGRDPGSRWATFVRWIGEHGYRLAGPPMEFWSGDDAHPQAQAMEMRIAVSKEK
ncbi:MAG: GyrI-like domain-containing protein [Terracidiphilus sp.]|nr:GyrI-like domain-containing protein [Terracidiphilus sp.]MDR3797366.1 GyrI-like domain-containing protein [Terracidiphilus sp.]